jgi:hypothetical protein
MPLNPPYRAPAPSSLGPSWSVPSLANQLRYVIRSAQPAIVFLSLAQISVPIFSEECTVDIVEDDGAAYRINYPRADPGREQVHIRVLSENRCVDRGYALRTRFTSTGYSGMMTHLWRTRVPTPADVSRAQILVRHGVDNVRAERPDGRHDHDRDTAEQLQAVAAVTDTRYPVARRLDPAVAALLEARARRLRQWARCETEHIARR